MRAILLALALLAAVPAAAAADTITIDGTSPGRTYDGDGGLSARRGRVV